MLTLIFVYMLVHLVVGTFVARADFSMRSANYAALGRDPVEDKITLQNLKLKFQNINHVSYCNMSYSSLRHKGCDCGSQNKWRENRDEISRLQSKVNGIPQARYLIIPFWPAHLIGNFVTGSSLRGATRRAEEIAEARHQVEIAELRERESAALDKELARINKKS